MTRTLCLILLLICAGIILYCTYDNESFISPNPEGDTVPLSYDDTFIDPVTLITYYLTIVLKPGTDNTIPSIPSYHGQVYTITLSWYINGISYKVIGDWNPYVLGNQWTATVPNNPDIWTLSLTPTNLTVRMPNGRSIRLDRTKKVADGDIDDITPTVMPYLWESSKYPYQYRHVSMEHDELGPAIMSCSVPIRNDQECPVNKIECTMNPHYNQRPDGKPLPICNMKWSTTMGTDQTGFQSYLNQNQSLVNTCNYPSAMVHIRNNALRKYLTVLPMTKSSHPVIWANPSPTDRISDPPPTNSPEYMDQNPLNKDPYSAFDLSVHSPTKFHIIPVKQMQEQCLVMLRHKHSNLKVTSTGQLEMTTYEDGVEQYFIWNQYSNGQISLSPMTNPQSILAYGSTSGYLAGSYVAECIPIRDQDKQKWLLTVEIAN